MSLLNYTTQQLQGGGKYSVKTKIGNWYEDMVMDETKFKDYIRLKESNNLMVAKKENKYANLLKKIPLEPFNGVLTTGHYFMLLNHKTNGFMVLDIDDKNINYKAAFAVTTSPLMTFSCPRSMFKFEKYSSDKHFNCIPEDQPVENVCFHEKIRIVCHPSVYETPLYLFSPLISPFSYSRFSRNQEVLISSEENFFNCWTIEHIDPAKRLEVQGQPVPSNEPFLIRHDQTGKLLSSDLIDYFNDFGHEYEMCANNYLPYGRYQKILPFDMKEDKVSEVQCNRVERTENIWSVVDFTPK